MPSPRLTRAFSTLGCVELSLDAALALASRHRLDAVELRGLGGSLDLPAWLKQTYAAPEAFAAHAQRSPVRIAALDTSLRLIDGDAAARAEFLKFVPWADAAGIPRLRVFDGGKVFDQAALTRALGTLTWWNTLRDENGWAVDLMIETHDALVTTPALQRFLTAAPAGTRLLWDAHHTWRQGGENPVATWQAIRKSVGHIHVKDSVNSPSGRHPYTYVLPGRGEFPMAALRAALIADGYAGIVSLEWERHWHPTLAPLEDALRAAAESAWW